MQSALITCFTTCNFSHDFWQLLLRWSPRPKQVVNRVLLNLKQTLHGVKKKKPNWSTSQTWARIGCTFMSKCFVVSNVWYRIRHHCVLTNTLLPRQMLVGFFFFPLNLKDRRDNRCCKAFLSYSLHCKMMHLLYLQADISALSWILHAEKCRGVPWLVRLRGH